MNDMNSVILEGRLTKDPYVGTTRNDNPFIALTLANNQYYKGEEDQQWIQKVCYMDCSLFGKLTNTFNAVKGDKVRVVGNLTMDDFYKIRIKVDHYEVTARLGK